MRVRKVSGPLAVQAIGGTHVVLLGVDFDEAKKDGLLGFAFHRTDHKTGKSGYLPGFKTFEATGANVPRGALVSTARHPVQGFLWSDFVAEPDRRYTYRVEALFGSPVALKAKHAVSVDVRTEPNDDALHSVHFNRGAAASQAYARRFKNVRPDKVSDRRAYRWLSRGLEEALISFIDKAEGDRHELWGAFYEFYYPSVLRAFARAKKRGVKVHLVYDAKENYDRKTGDPQGPHSKNLAALKEHGLEDVAVPRKSNRSYISHNKFVVLGERNKGPQAVWTGSTNVSEGGIFGHSNVGHVVRHPKVAKAYLAYWKELSQDSGAKELRPWCEARSPIPAARPPKGCTPIFSPRASLDALEWYARLMDGARQGVFFTAAFGINKLINKILSKDKDYLRYCLLESFDEKMTVIERDADNRFAVGSLIADNALEHWLTEQLTGFNNHVRYIHTKYMLIDPLTDDPVLITGSANFSDASTKSNDENMLVIRGDTRVADIYLGEFMRLFNHFRFRQVAAKVGGDANERLNLTPDDSWTEPYYKKKSYRAKERIAFAGS